MEKKINIVVKDLKKEGCFCQNRESERRKTLVIKVITSFLQFAVQ